MAARDLGTKMKNRPNREGLVIVVDDDHAVRKALQFSLEAEGFVVRAFADGSTLLRESELVNCGCLIVDQNMPGMNGLDLIDRLRDRKILAPAILITTGPSQVLRERAASAGVCIVEKPLLGNILLDEICNALTLPSSPSH